jgi:hypothetical protein
MRLPDDFSYAFHAVKTPVRGGRPIQCLMVGCHGLATTQVVPSEGQIRYVCTHCMKYVARFPQQAEYVYLMTHSSASKAAYSKPKVKRVTPRSSRYVQSDWVGN